MTLERELQALGIELAWPETPDLATAVRVAVETTPRGRRPLFGRRPGLAIALAVLVVVAAALAVPPARTAILRALGIGSVRVQLVDELPPLSPRLQLSLLGPPLTLAEARERFPGRLLVPDSDTLGLPDEIRVLDAPAQVSYVWLQPPGVRLLVSVISGRFVGSGFVKVIGPETTLDELTVDGRRALWITGEAHGFGLEGASGVDFEELRLAGNALLVDDDGTTIRVEGDLALDQAIRVVRALR
jgi:hypothetical protein